MGKRCDMCFQFKDPLVPVIPKAHTQVCKACSYKVSQVTGFLEYHGVTLAYQPELEMSEEAIIEKKRGNGKNKG